MEEIESDIGEKLPEFKKDSEKRRYAVELIVTDSVAVGDLGRVAIDV
jgi:hypothetical protein